MGGIISWPHHNVNVVVFLLFVYVCVCVCVYRCLRSDFPGWGRVWQGIQLDVVEEVSFFVHCSCPEVELLDEVWRIKKIG